MQASEWAARQPAAAWQEVEVRPGTQGPLVVQALTRRVQTRDDQGRVGLEERLLVIRTAAEGHPKIDYSLSNAGPEIQVNDLVQAHAQRYRIEQMLEEGKGDAGLDHDEVRSGVGWHHPMTLALLALWFLPTERGRVGENMCPAVTTPQIQEIFSRLLRNPPPTSAQIAAQVSDDLQRNEEARIYSLAPTYRRLSPASAAGGVGMNGYSRNI